MKIYNCIWIACCCFSDTFTANHFNSAGAFNVLKITFITKQGLGKKIHCMRGIPRLSVIQWGGFQIYGA